MHEKRMSEGMIFSHFTSETVKNRRNKLVKFSSQLVTEFVLTH